MKKILIVFVGLSVFSFALAAYNPTKTDQDLLEGVYPKLDKIISDDKSKAENIENKIAQIKENYKEKQQIYYILTQIYNYLDQKLNSDEAKDVVASLLSGSDAVLSGNQTLGKSDASSIKLSEKISCSEKTTCAEMSSCDEAKFYLKECGLTRLDADDDGIPCESICK